MHVRIPCPPGDDSVHTESSARKSQSRFRQTICRVSARHQPGAAAGPPVDGAGRGGGEVEGKIASEMLWPTLLAVSPAVLNEAFGLRKVSLGSFDIQRASGIKAAMPTAAPIIVIPGLIRASYERPADEIFRRPAA
jgi:hypothetical protein